MKNKCESFILMLQEYPETPLDKETQEHLTVCESCQELLERHNQKFASLKSQLALPSQKEQQIFARLQQTISAQKKQQGDSPFSYLLNWLCLYRLQLVLPLALLVLTVLFFSQKNPGNKMQISGSAVVMRGMLRSELDQRIVSLLDGEKISLLEGHINLFWNKIETVKITGKLDFSAEDRKIEAKSGEAVLSFTKSAAGYTIKTPRSLLTIVGTTIKLELLENSDVIHVEQGKIEWSLGDKTRKGKAAAGSKILIRGSQGSFVVEEGFSDPDFSADGTQKLNHGVKTIKSGDNWVPMDNQVPRPD